MLLRRRYSQERGCLWKDLHRSAPSIERLPLKLTTTPVPFLELVEEAASLSVEDGVIELLTQAQTPLRFEDLRKALQVRACRLSDALKILRRRNDIEHSTLGYHLFSRRD